MKTLNYSMRPSVLLAPKQYSKKVVSESAFHKIKAETFEYRLFQQIVAEQDITKMNKLIKQYNRIAQVKGTGKYKGTFAVI